MLIEIILCQYFSFSLPLRVPDRENEIMDKSRGTKRLKGYEECQYSYCNFFRLSTRIRNSIKSVYIP